LEGHPSGNLLTEVSGVVAAAIIPRYNVKRKNKQAPTVYEASTGIRWNTEDGNDCGTA
jgi:hypothetical protein